MEHPLFSEEARAWMQKGTSSKWAADLTVADLPALVWMVGEFGRRANPILAALDEHWSTTPPRDPIAAGRAKLALEGLFRLVRGDRPSIEEYVARWGPIGARLWASITGDILAPEEMGSWWPVVWQGQAVGSLKDPRHQEFGCIGSFVAATPAPESFEAALWGSPQTPVLVAIGGVPALIKEPPAPSGALSVMWLGPPA